AVPMSTAIRAICSRCCARTAVGHMTVAPPRSMMNSRRLIAPPEAQDEASYRFKPVLGKAPPMSALGQKRTLEQVRVMSALPPKADIRIGSDYVRRSNSGSLAIFAAIRRASLLFVVSLFVLVAPFRAH